MSSNNMSFGAYGENIAATFLQRNGFEILIRNFRCGKNEIDIIARKEKMISFVEVKTRQGLTFGHPLEAITKSKQKEMAKAAECYLRKFPMNADSCRFDIVAIVFTSNNEPEISFIEDAFRVM